MSSTSKKVPTNAERKYFKDENQEHHNDTLISIYHKYESQFDNAKSNKERGNLWKKVTDDYNDQLGCCFTKDHVRQHFNSNIKGADKKKEWKNNNRLKKRLAKTTPLPSTSKPQDLQQYSTQDQNTTEDFDDIPIPLEEFKDDINDITISAEEFEFDMQIDGNLVKIMKK